MKHTELTSEISCPTDSCLEHQSNDQEVMDSNFFLTKFIFAVEL